MNKTFRFLALVMAVIFALGCLGVANAALSAGASVTVLTTTNIYLPSSTSASGQITLTQSNKQLAAGTRLNILGTNGNWVMIHRRSRRHYQLQ